MTQANKPYTFTNGQTADATQVNSDFDTLYTDINGNLDESNIKDGTLSTAVAQEGVKPSQTEGLPYAIDLFGRSFIVSGGLPTKDSTNANQVNVPAYAAYILQADGSLRRITTTATNYKTTVAGGTFYLDLNPDGTFTWNGSHSTQANYIPICTVVADVNSNVSTITDNRPPTIAYLDINNTFPTSLFNPFVLTGITPSKDGTTANKLNVTSGSAFLLESDNTIRLKTISATSFTTSALSTTYYLDLNPDSSLSWGTSHSTQSNYIAIAQVTTDANGNISAVHDVAQRTANMLPNLSSSRLQVGGITPGKPTVGSEYAFSGLDGDVTITANTTMPRKVMFYRNLTVNAGVTLSANSGGLNIIYVSETLTLKGTIQSLTGGAGAASQYGSGAGGQGGGAIFVFANTIDSTSNGVITASGANGSNGVASTGGAAGYYGAAGANGAFIGQSIPGGAVLQSLAAAQQGGAGGTTPSGFRSFIDMLLTNFYQAVTTDTGAGGGASGDTNGATSTSALCLSNGGGAGFVGNGGAGGGFATGSATTVGQTSGGSGGGGGLVVLYSSNNIPSITVSANGGNGGNGYGQACAGGAGGGGGFALVIAPSSSATLSANGGTAGTPADTTYPPQNGGAGFANFVVS